MGKRGSLILKNDAIVRVNPIGGGSALDTTGAGDLWASGFFYGLLNDLPLETCGEIASACGYEVCQVEGATIPKEGWIRIKERISQK